MHEYRGRVSDVTVSGIGHSVIRGSDCSANRSMVRRERYSLASWIIVSNYNVNRVCS